MFISLHNHSHYSLLDGLSKPKQMAQRASEIGMNALALTDHGTVAGVVQFVKAMRAKDIKPILGCEFYLSKQMPNVKNSSNKKHNHLVVLAKSEAGWHNLLRAVAASNNPDHFYYKPRLHRSMFAPFADGLVTFSGHVGSELASCIWLDDADWNLDNINDMRRQLRPDWKEQAILIAQEYQDIFGSENFFIEVQLVCSPNKPLLQVTAECMRTVSDEAMISPVATADAHYAFKEQCHDQRVLVATSLNLQLPDVAKRIAAGESVPLKEFFVSDCFHIPSHDEMVSLHTQHEIEMSQHISDMCEDYDILQAPVLPKFKCPDGYDPKSYLLKMCRDGWMEKFKNNGVVDGFSKELKAEYGERVKYELEVINGADLSSYFLIVADYIEAAKQRGDLVGVGRGSAAGSIVSYLLSITGIDPIKYGLMFERFYNAGRNTKDRVSLPDIDTDFPIEKRQDTIDYISEKYGEENVSYIITFGTMKGRAALKDVMRAHNVSSFDEINYITKGIPEEASISDELQAMEEERGESSIIRWALENESKHFADYCQLNEDGTLTGEMAELFAQAIRLEGTKRNQSRHAAGIVISAKPLKECCPLVYDTKSKHFIAGLEMEDLESIGLIKFDILGVAMLDKIMAVQDLLRCEDE